VSLQELWWRCLATGSKRLTNFVQSDAQGVRYDAATIPNNKRRGLLGFKQGMDLWQLSKHVTQEVWAFVWRMIGAATSVQCLLISRIAGFRDLSEQLKQLNSP
jgi:hypothetical protein